MATPKRAPLTRDAVIAAAIELADADGLDGLSMRSLARAVGVEAMSLYHHVANKDDLLDGMVDAVFVEVERPTAGDPGRPALRARCASLLEVLLRHPWAVGLLDNRRAPGPATLGHHDAVIGSLRGGGFDVRTSALAFATLDAFVIGFAVQAISLPFEPDESVTELVEEMLGDTAEAFPHLTEMAREHVMRPDYRFADEFEPGLDLILDGLERLLPRRRR